MIFFRFILPLLLHYLEFLLYWLMTLSAESFSSLSPLETFGNCSDEGWYGVDDSDDWHCLDVLMFWRAFSVWVGSVNHSFNECSTKEPNWPRAFGWPLDAWPHGVNYQPFPILQTWERPDIIFLRTPLVERSEKFIQQFISVMTQTLIQWLGISRSFEKYLNKFPRPSQDIHKK